MFHFIALDLASLTNDVSILSSIAVITGVLFVAVQLRQNNRLVSATSEQAKAAAVLAELTTQQMEQNNQLANMDMILRLYEFADSAEFQSAWLTVLSSKISSFEEFEKLPRQDQISVYQVAALFESLGVLVERGIVKVDIIDDMFLTELAWTTLEPFVIGIRKKFGSDQGYTSFEGLYKKLCEHKNAEQMTKPVETDTSSR
ncbi:MAG: DUF4760 domain-containing protein [Nitrososphaerales archaeon]